MSQQSQRSNNNLNNNNQQMQNSQLNNNQQQMQASNSGNQQQQMQQSNRSRQQMQGSQQNNTQQQQMQGSQYNNNQQQNNNQSQQMQASNNSRVLNNQSQVQQQNQNNDMNQTTQSMKPVEPIVINQPCVYPDHEDGIMGICLKANCEKKSRLVCFTCAISNHHEHGQYIVRLTDMAKSNDLFIRNWPYNAQAIDINKYLQISQPEEAIKMVHSQFDKYKEQYNKKLDECRDKMVEDIKTKLQRNEKILKDVYQKMDDTYNLQGVKTIIKDLNENKIDGPQFNKQLQEFLTGKNTQVYQIELEDLYIKQKKKVHDTFNKDLLTHFFDKSFKIMEDVPQLIWPKNATVKIDNKGNVGSITSGLNSKIHKKF